MCRKKSMNGLSSAASLSSSGTATLFRLSAFLDLPSPKEPQVTGYSRYLLNPGKPP